MDLNEIVTKKPLKGINTFLFGDNRQGKCGIGTDTPFIVNPQSLYA
jgi:hypothetical protein